MFFHNCFSSCTNQVIMSFAPGVVLFRNFYRKTRYTPEVARGRAGALKGTTALGWEENVINSHLRLPMKLRTPECAEKHLHHVNPFSYKTPPGTQYAP